MMKARYILIIIGTLFLTSKSSGQWLYRELGEYCKKSSNYALSIKYFKKAANKKQNDKTIREIGNVYFELRQYDSAKVYLYKIKDKTKKDWLNIGTVELMQGNTIVAERIFNKCVPDSSDRVMNLRVATSWLKIHNTVDKDVAVSMLNINNIHKSYGAFFDRDKIVYSGVEVADSANQVFNMPGSRYTNLYQVELYGDEVKNPKLFSADLKKDYDEGGPTFTATIDSTRKMYFARTDIGRFNNTIIHICEAVKSKEDWYLNKVLPFDSALYKCSFPAVAPDGSFIIFVAEYKNGMGKNDLYLSNNINGEWQKPINMGRAINSPGNETFPFIDSEFNLYFASDWHWGFGGYDIFTCKYEDGKWGAVQNMLKPINSSLDDYAFSVHPVNKKMAILASNRDSVQSDRIYLVKQKEPFHQKYYSQVHKTLITDEVIIDIYLKDEQELNDIQKETSYPIRKNSKTPFLYHIILPTFNDAKKVLKKISSYAPKIRDQNQKNDKSD